MKRHIRERFKNKPCLHFAANLNAGGEKEHHRLDRPACAKGGNEVPEIFEVSPLLYFNEPPVMSASPQPQNQALQGAGSAVGPPACAPTRGKDVGNSNLGTFGVCCNLMSCCQHCLKSDVTMPL